MGNAISRIVIWTTGRTGSDRNDARGSTTGRDRKSSHGTNRETPRVEFIWTEDYVDRSDTDRICRTLKKSQISERQKMNITEKLKKVLDAMQPPWSAALTPASGFTAPELKREKIRTFRVVSRKYPPDFIRTKPPSCTAGNDVELPQNGATPETRESRMLPAHVEFEIAAFSCTQALVRPNRTIPGGTE